MTLALLILLQTWWLSAQAQHDIQWANEHLEPKLIAVNPSQLAVLNSNDLQVIRAVEMPQLSSDFVVHIVPPAPTELSVIAFPSTKTIQLDWKCQAGHQFEVRIVRDGEVQPRVELTYAHNSTNFNWTHTFSGSTNVVSVRRIHPQSEWSSEIKITANQKEEK